MNGEIVIPEKAVITGYQPGDCFDTVCKNIKCENCILNWRNQNEYAKECEKQGVSVKWAN